MRNHSSPGRLAGVIARWLAGSLLCISCLPLTLSDTSPADALVPIDCSAVAEAIDQTASQNVEVLATESGVFLSEDGPVEVSSILVRPLAAPTRGEGTAEHDALSVADLVPGSLLRRLEEDRC